MTGFTGRMNNRLNGNMILHGNVVYVKGWFVMADYIVKVDGQKITEFKSDLVMNIREINNAR